MGRQGSSSSTLPWTSERVTAPKLPANRPVATKNYPHYSADGSTEQSGYCSCWHCSSVTSTRSRGSSCLPSRVSSSASSRSEERRVGEECSARWSREQKTAYELAT